ncbi:hypothetical protein HK099_008237 [Clydaea vesicula]|uniref:Translin n=1 Tax=Clydaea vesicula TaxID=447962 RepID=A0AAD5Y2H5_9FUNG|nr:hypothetical protein HK099_008237 [Clydaea vesicula]
MSQIFEPSIFDSIIATIEDDSKQRELIKEVQRELEKSARQISTVLNQVHTNPTKEAINSSVETATNLFRNIRKNLSDLSKLISPELVYKFNNMWSYSVQQACFLAALTEYFRSERLITISELENVLGIKVSLNGDYSGFHITIEDVLNGYVNITSYLSRLALNSVTHGDFARPLRISRFVNDLYTGFQLLNLKNDGLRKKFDAIKYDVKKIEEVFIVTSN